MPTVSAIIALYNRADAIQRAIRSVQNQTFTDWELIVVDDGSTDGSAALIEGMDPRMTIIRQNNKGFVEARNTGLRAAKGELIAFLDDDDEWLPFHLELGVRFLEAHPDAMFVDTELREEFGLGRSLTHYRVETGIRYPYMAARIHSKGFDLPPGETDDYLRIYTSKVPVGAWGKSILDRAGVLEPVYHYSGNLFPHLRWGYLMAVNALMVRRRVIAEIGFQNPHYNLAADYHLIAELCKRTPAHFLSVTTYIKHELNKEGKALASGHIVTGPRALICAMDEIRSFEDLFWKGDPENPELRALRAGKYFGASLIALQVGDRAAALSCLKVARLESPFYGRSIVMELFVRALPSPRLAQKVYIMMKKMYFACIDLRHGDLTLGAFLFKVAENLVENIAP